MNYFRPVRKATKIAIVHEWLAVYAGSEKVLEQMLDIWPEADLFAVVDFLSAENRQFLKGKVAKTTFLQKMPMAASKFRHYLPLMPIAIEQLDLSGYDIVISSNHAVAKGVITGPDQLHVSYVHSPIRYAWDLQHQYLAESGLTRGLLGVIVRCVLHYIRLWDVRTANGVDAFVANSIFIARRIHKVYQRKADVIYPPVDVARFTLREKKENFYFTASRMVHYKKVLLVVQAFAKMPDKQLIVIGEGPEFEKVKAAATPNVVLLGYQTTEIVVDYMQRARAFVFAAEEDFGITPVEAQACGTPVIAFGKGGSLETVCVGDDVTRRTGVFFYEQTTDAIIDAVNRFENDKIGFNPKVCRTHAEKFSPLAFKDQFSHYVQKLWAEFIHLDQ